ncbi:MAG: PadR family transcriptional regulator [Coriobacteriia bacterium]|nr:PadR family transcriptional regulator [Coriobacteriia bacterium]
MSLAHAILGFLREQAMTGYELKTLCFDHDAQHFWTADQAQIYRTLEGLEKRGHVTSRVKRQRSRPDRKVYSITPAGVEELDRWAATPAPLPPLRDPFLIQLRFADRLSDEDLLHIVRERRSAMQQRLDILRARAAEEAKGAGRDAILHRLTLGAAMSDARSTIDWLDGALETLSDLIEQEHPTEPGTQSRLFARRTDERGSTS